MNIGYVFDDNFACCAAVSIVSLMINNTHVEDLHFFIFEDNISKNTRENIINLIKKYNRKVDFYNIQPIINQLERLHVEPWRGKYSAYIKLLISQLLPPEINRFILIDADTIINGDLTELATMELHNHPCAMAFEGIHADYRKYSGIGNFSLYNTGVIVYDLFSWRATKVEERFLYHLKNINAHYMLPEEDPISIILKNDVEYLHPKYNFITQFYLYGTPKYFKRFKWDTMNRYFYSLDEIQDSQKDVRIYHCIDTFTNRPWNQNNIHPYSNIFDIYLDQTPWKNHQKNKVEMSFVPKIEYTLRKKLPHRLSIYFYYLSAKIYYTIGAKRFYKKRKGKRL